MKEKTENKILEIIEFVVLITLIFIRLVTKENDNIWISQLNYLGLVIAFSSFFVTLCDKFSAEKKFIVVAGIFVVLLIPLAIIGGLILSNVITLNTKWNDIILLATLLFSLPTRLYLDWISAFIKK